MQCQLGASRSMLRSGMSGASRGCADPCTTTHDHTFAHVPTRLPNWL